MRFSSTLNSYKGLLFVLKVQQTKCKRTLGNCEFRASTLTEAKVTRSASTELLIIFLDKPLDCPAKKNAADVGVTAVFSHLPISHLICVKHVTSRLLLA
jgi:hypothetical protein